MDGLRRGDYAPPENHELVSLRARLTLPFPEERLVLSFPERGLAQVETAGGSRTLPCRCVKAADTAYLLALDGGFLALETETGAALWWKEAAGAVSHTPGLPGTGLAGNTLRWRFSPSREETHAYGPEGLLLRDGRERPYLCAALDSARILLATEELCLLLDFDRVYAAGFRREGALLHPVGAIGRFVDL